MSYRAIEFRLLLRHRSQWTTFTASRKEAARLWNDMIVRHARIRRLKWKWPSYARWCRWVRRKYPGLSAQSAQQVLKEFCEAVNSTRELRKRGHDEASYPWKRHRYRDVTYTNQDARIRDGWLILPNGKSGTLRLNIPDGVTISGTLQEVHVAYGRVMLVCIIPDEIKPAGPVIGIDLGVNTLIAATDGEKVLLISGREAKATVQWRNKRLATIATSQIRKLKGSRRWKRLQRRKRQLLAKAARRTKDLVHKATDLVAKEFPNARAFVGEPFNDAAQKCGRVQAQQVSQACNARIIAQLDYKLAGAIEVPEHYSSQTCPVCGGRRKCRRIYRCKDCRYSAPRDVVGATNILRIGRHGLMTPSPDVPGIIKYRRPVAVVQADTLQVAR